MIQTVLTHAVIIPVMILITWQEMYGGCQHGISIRNGSFFYCYFIKCSLSFFFFSETCCIMNISYELTEACYFLVMMISITGQHSGARVPGLILSSWYCLMWSFTCSVGFFTWLYGFLPPPRKCLFVDQCEWVCAWCSVIDRSTIQIVFPPRAHCQGRDLEWSMKPRYDACVEAEQVSQMVFLRESQLVNLQATSHNLHILSSRESHEKFNLLIPHSFLQHSCTRLLTNEELRQRDD